MPSDWQTIAGATKTLEDELGLAPGKARQSVIEAVARHRLPTRWMAEDDATKIERLRLAPGESLRIGVSGDPDNDLRPAGCCRGPRVGPGLGARRIAGAPAWCTRRPSWRAPWANRSRPAARRPRPPCPSISREPETPEAVEARPAEDVAPPEAEPAPADDLQAVADDCMTDYLKKHKIDRGPGQRPQFANRDNAIPDCYRLVKGRGVKRKHLEAAYGKAPRWPEAGPDALAGVGKPRPK